MYPAIGVGDATAAPIPQATTTTGLTTGQRVAIALGVVGAMAGLVWVATEMGEKDMGRKKNPIHESGYAVIEFDDGQENGIMIFDTKREAYEYMMSTFKEYGGLPGFSMVVGSFNSAEEYERLLRQHGLASRRKHSKVGRRR